ncbi:MAG: HAD family hydrolase [Chloroflexota bacterium]
MSMDIVASDLEGTLSAGQTWRGMRTYLEAHGQADAFRRFFRRRLPALVLYRLHLVDDRAFKERWILDVLRLFTGYTPSAFADVAQWVVESELWPQRRQGVVAELEQHRENGRRVLVISGLFQPMLDVFTGRLGVEGIGTPLLFANGRFTEPDCRSLQCWRLQSGTVAAAYGQQSPCRRLRRYRGRHSYAAPEPGSGCRSPRSNTAARSCRVRLAYS